MVCFLSLILAPFGLGVDLVIPWTINASLGGKLINFFGRQKEKKKGKKGNTNSKLICRQ